MEHLACSRTVLEGAVAVPRAWVDPIAPALRALGHGAGGTRVGLWTSSVFLTTPDAGAALILFGRADMASPVPDQQECADGHGPARPDYLRTRIAGSSVQRRLVIISCARSWMAAASWLRPCA